MGRRRRRRRGPAKGRREWPTIACHVRKGKAVRVNAAPAESSLRLDEIYLLLTLFKLRWFHQSGRPQPLRLNVCAPRSPHEGVRNTS